jgi:release factor glutamine methyltransferase
MARPRINADSTIKDALREGTERIQNKTASTEGRLEAELLLCHALGIDRAHLYQRLSDPIGPAAEAFANYVARRCAHEPTPYITGHREFFGLDLEVSPAALIPRPETETLVEAIIAFANQRFGGLPFTIADIGTGCGTIAVSVSHALPNARVIATDQSLNTIALAKRNAGQHGVESRIDFRLGDLLEPLTEPVDTIAANLPYVCTDDWKALPPEIREHEPREALDGGADGLRIIERLLHAVPPILATRGALFAEIGDGQESAATTIARAILPGATVDVLDDLSGKARVLTIRLQ